VAVLRVLSGPDAGREFSLPAGNSTIGAGVTSDVMLTDPGIADVHAALTVGESVEVSNLAGPSGVLIGAQAVQRGAVGATDELRLANTTIAVLPIARASSADGDSAAIEFNRSPRVVTRFAARTFPAAAPPQRPEPAPLPIISMLLPLVLGVAMFAVTRSLVGVVFIALSPLLMVGMYLDTRFQNKKKYQEAVRRFSAGSGPCCGRTAPSIQSSSRCAWVWATRRRAAASN
jgi:S-DNA-T family DNA segregation ATPase FtsK/SpoIIIE